VAPENTWPSFRAAYEGGADMVELDVQLTRDGVAIVYHDFSLFPRFGDPRWVRDLSWDDLRGLDAGRWFSPDFAGERIPLFADVLDWARGRVALWVDLKHGFLEPDDERLEKAALELIDNAGMAEQVVIVSWDQVALARIRDHRPELPLAVNLPQRMIDPVAAVRRAGARWVAANWPQVNGQCVAAWHEAGIQVALANLFTNDYGEAQRLGVDAIVTKDPATARVALRHIEHD
jgi:glycerophosphoryl diester phosphodiesterase